MKALDPGHVYSLDVFDGEAEAVLIFMKREGNGYPGNVGAHPGTNCQEVLRALIDRVEYLNMQIQHPQNDLIISSLRTALTAFEVRAAERHGRKFIPAIMIERELPCKKCGHIGCSHTISREQKTTTAEGQT